MAGLLRFGAWNICKNPDIAPSMMIFARQCSLLFVAAALLIAALSTGHARGQMPAAGQIVICLGLHIATVTVDENGQPTTAHQTCPDAITDLTSPAIAPPQLVRAAEVTRVQRRNIARDIRPRPPVIVTRARAPPRPV
jgi:hypothetical protein